MMDMFLSIDLRLMNSKKKIDMRIRVSSKLCSHKRTDSSKEMIKEIVSKVVATMAALSAFILKVKVPVIVVDQGEMHLATYARR